MMEKSRSVLRVLAVVSAAVMMLCVPAALGAPGTPWLADSPTLALPDLGLDPDLLLYGQIGTATLTVPVPAGMTPATLNLTAQLPVNVRSATITVSQENRVIARVDVPARPGPLVIPLAGARVVENSVAVLLRSYLLPVEGYCLDPTNPLRLTDASVTYSGLEHTPDVVADFLPPILRKLVIYTRRDPSQTEADAVVQLAAAIAAHYGKQNPAIEVAALPTPSASPPEAAPFERHIVVAEGPSAGVSLLPGGGMRALLISGSTGQLVNQTRLLTSRLASYALSSKAVVGPLNSTPQLPGNDTTIRKLGQPGVNAVSLNPQVGIALDQTRLGRAAHHIRVHLQGSYTPLPASIGGQVVATIAGETIDRWSADPGGVVDRWVDVPDRMLRRYTTLAVQVNISGNTGDCGEFQPITLTIDGESAVHSEPAQPPVPVGFQSLPQALMPRVLIGIGPDRFADTVRAVQIMTGLQRLSALPIDTSVVPLAEAIKDLNPAVLIAPQGWHDPAAPLPVSAPNAVPMTLNAFDDDGNTTTLTLEPGLKFASLQVVFDGRRSVLVATSNGAPGQLDALLGWLSADARRWSIIDGVALVSVAGRDPITVTAAEPRQEAPSQASPVARWWWFGAALLAIVVALTAWLWVKERRRAGDG
jgi:hypothetical protein